MQYYELPPEDKDGIEVTRLANMPVVARTNYLRRMQRRANRDD